MTELALSRALKIRTLHDEIEQSFRMSLQKALEIGELLTEQKRELGHGEFVKWINENLPFTDRTARNYMSLFENKDKLITESVSDLNEAYQLLRNNDDNFIKTAMKLHKEVIARNCFDELKEWTKILKELLQGYSGLLLDLDCKIGELIKEGK